jgi:hypothetical protein
LIGDEPVGEEIESIWGSEDNIFFVQIFRDRVGSTSVWTLDLDS